MALSTALHMACWAMPRSPVQSTSNQPRPLGLRRDRVSDKLLDVLSRVPYPRAQNREAVALKDEAPPGSRIGNLRPFNKNSQSTCGKPSHSTARDAKSDPGNSGAEALLLTSLSCLLLSDQSASAAAVLSTMADVATPMEGTGYSEASYYTSLALFVISIPGLWSLIKRATKSKIVRRTFEVAGPAAGGKPLAKVAGEITSLLNRSNYKVKEAKDVVTFEGDIIPSRSQAAFLVFCTALSLASVALVLSIAVPDVGDWWYTMVALSPLAGAYYWRKAARKEEIQVKIVISDDEKSADIIMQGDDEEIERVRRELQLMEKGLEYIKGVFEA